MSETTNIIQSPPSADHDLLVELKTEMKGVRSDLRELRDGTASRLTAVEMGKLDKSEASRMEQDSNKIHVDHESRIRSLETKVWLALGAVAIIEPIATAIIIKYFVR